MKTLGEILKSSRSDLDLTLAEVSKSTKIELRHLKSLEEDDYTSLPHPAFTKGFIRKYAAILGKPPEDLVAIYRRDYHLPTTPTHPTPSTSTPASSNFFLRLNRSTTTLLIIGIVTFLSYLAFQYRALLLPPPLEILRPENNAVVTSPVLIEGSTSSDSLITIDPEITIKPDPSGNFLTELNLSPGSHNIKITATNRFSKSAIKTLSITVISQ